MWSGDNTYFTNFLTTPGHNWQAGNDDMSVSDEAVIPDAISVGAYVSRKQWVNWEDSVQSMDERYTVGDIGYFSGYATAAESPSGLSYPWITAPGSMVAAAVSPYHTQDEGSYFDGTKNRLLVNDTVNPYGVMQGTSMATPVASGIVALWLQAAQEVGKTLTVNEVKHIMQQTAIHDSWTAGANATHFGQGKIDALAGIQYIRSHYAALTIDDDGKPFDPTAASPTDFSVPADQRPSGGLGIMFLHQMADGLEYQRIDGHNILRIEMSYNHEIVQSI